MFELLRDARKYKYTVSASGGGKLAFRVECLSTWHEQGRPNHELWSVIEDKSKIESGTTLNGSFNAPASYTATGATPPQSLLRIYFTRAVLSEGVNYKFEMSPAE
jgi:hypothetical protein